MTLRGVLVAASLALAPCAKPVGEPTDPKLTPKCRCPYCGCVVEAKVGDHDAGTMLLDGKFTAAGLKLDFAELPVGEAKAAAPGVPGSATPRTANAASGIPLKLQVSGDRMSAVETAAPFQTLTGQALQGITIWVSDTQQGQYKLVVTNVYLQNLNFW